MAQAQLKPGVSLIAGAGAGNHYLGDGVGQFIKLGFNGHTTLRFELTGVNGFTLLAGGSIFRQNTVYVNGYLNENFEAFDRLARSDYAGGLLGFGQKINVGKAGSLMIYVQARLAGHLQTRLLARDVPDSDPYKNIEADYYEDVLADVGLGLEYRLPLNDKLGLLIQAQGTFQLNDAIESNLSNHKYIGGTLGVGLNFQP